MKTKLLIFLLFIALGTSVTTCQDTPQTRKPYTAGCFYCTDPDELKAILQKLFAAAISRKSGDIPLAIIAPMPGMHLAER